MVAHFGTLQELQHALKDPTNFPDVQIAPKGTLLGKARIDKLVELLSPP